MPYGSFETRSWSSGTRMWRLAFRFRQKLNPSLKWPHYHLPRGIGQENGQLWSLNRSLVVRSGEGKKGRESHLECARQEIHQCWSNWVIQVSKGIRSCHFRFRSESRIWVCSSATIIPSVYFTSSQESATLTWAHIKIFPISELVPLDDNILVFFFWNKGGKHPKWCPLMITY